MSTITNTTLNNKLSNLQLNSQIQQILPTYSILEY